MITAKNAGLDEINVMRAIEHGKSVLQIGWQSKETDSFRLRATQNRIRLVSSVPSFSSARRRDGIALGSIRAAHALVSIPPSHLYLNMNQVDKGKDERIL